MTIQSVMGFHKRSASDGLTVARLSPSCKSRDDEAHKQAKAEAEVGKGNSFAEASGPSPTCIFGLRKQAKGITWNRHAIFVSVLMQSAAAGVDFSKKAFCKAPASLF
jgi:hypothetical protein